MTRSSTRPAVALALLVAPVALALPLAAQRRKLSGPLAREPVGRIFGSSCTSTGRLVYGVDELGDSNTALRSIPLSGSEASRELWPGPAGLMGFTFDGKQVLFVADLDGNGLVELAVVPGDGSSPARSLASVEAAEEFIGSLQVSPDLEHVLYLSSAYLSGPPNFALRSELYAVSLLGTPAPVRLNGVPVSGGSVESAALSRDGRSVVYRADESEDGVLELFVVPVDGSLPARKLPIPLVAGGSTVSCAFDSGGTHVLYTADQAEDERYELFSIAT